jgi:uncharacterized membrane protein YgcG
VAQVAAGDGLTPRQQERIEEAVESARTQNGLDISVLVGDLELEDLSQFRAACERLHAALGERSPSAVLIVVAPGQRRVEVVTGPAVRRRVPDRISALAVLSMTSAFRGGDLTGGIVDAVRQIADAAGRRKGPSIAEDRRSVMARRADSLHGSASDPGARAVH